MIAENYFVAFDPYITYSKNVPGEFWRTEKLRSLNKREAKRFSIEAFALWELGEDAFKLIGEGVSKASFLDARKEFDTLISDLRVGAEKHWAKPQYSELLEFMRFGSPFEILFLANAIKQIPKFTDYKVDPTYRCTNLAIGSLCAVDLALGSLMIGKGNPLRFALVAAKLLRIGESARSAHTGVSKELGNLAVANAIRSHRDDYANREFVIKYYEAHKNEFRSADHAADEILKKNLVKAAHRTLANWIRTHKRGIVSQ